MSRISILFIVVFIASCKYQPLNVKLEQNEITTITAEDYELIKTQKSTSLLVIFPGGGSTAQETKEDFKITEKATENGISVLFMNFSQHLWIENQDSKQLSILITEAIEKNKLEVTKLFIGGISLGGTVALTLSNYLMKTDSPLIPTGVFVVDSPIDLYALYESSLKDLARKDFSEERLAEPKWIINYFEEQFGGKDSLLSNIQKVSPITTKTKNVNNIKFLRESKIRFYTEPDTLWWKENRQTDFESTNAFIIQKTHQILSDENWENAELIQTKNKGYRTNGEKNPHSWSIIDVHDFINWVLE